MIRAREVPWSLGPSPIGMPTFVASRTLSRRPSTALPRISSDSPREYASAVSNMLQPMSSDASTSEVASATSVVPHFLKNSEPPPNVAVPSIKAGTFRPEPPRLRYCIVGLSSKSNGLAEAAGTR